MRILGRKTAAAFAAAGLVVVAAACKPSSAASDGGLPATSSTLSSWPAPPAAGSEQGASKPGMVFVEAGQLSAGTSPSKTPRIADEEMPGTTLEMGGFYIDLLPWPNEPNAIPTTAVTRDEAEQMCETKQKRLCTELEWERACKGPQNFTYEYGDAYRKEPCETGISLEQASRRPTGEHAQCKSGFGVLEMHGGVWEWTSSAWGRGTKDKDASQGVLRGGNSVAGELVGRCANAIAREGSKKAPTMGFRCCSGPKSQAEVHLEQVGTPTLTMIANSLGATWMPVLANLLGVPQTELEPKLEHVWEWIPIPNEDLVILQGCTTAPTLSRSCGFVVARKNGAESVQSAVTGRDPPEINRGADMRHLRVRSLDQHGTFTRDLTYVYGRVDLSVLRRP